MHNKTKSAWSKLSRKYAYERYLLDLYENYLIFCKFANYNPVNLNEFLVYDCLWKLSTK